MFYLIWSYRHSQWWRANCSGYSAHIDDAGRYDAREAGEIVVGSGLPGQNVAVHEDIAIRIFATLDVDETEQRLEDYKRI